MRVLEHEQGRTGNHRRQKRGDRLVQLRAAVLFRQHLDLGRRRNLEPERNADERQPRLQLRRLARDDLAQTLLDRLVRVVAPEAQLFAQQFLPHRVRRRGRVRLAHRVQNAKAGRLRAQCFEQAGLAHPGLPDDLDHAAGARARGVERLAQHLEFRVAPDQRQRLQRHMARARARRRSHRPRLDRLRLALDHERLERRRREQRVRPVEHVGRRIDLPRSGLGHQPRREVHRVAHHRVRAAVEGADVAGEDRAAIDADADGDRHVGVDDRAQRQQHALLVVAGDDRRAGGEDQLAAVDVAVRREQRDALRLGRGLDHADQAMQRLGGGCGPLLLDHRVRALDPDERDRDRPVLGRAAASEHVRANGGRQAARQRVVRNRRPRDQRDFLLARRLPLQQHAGAFGGAEAPGRQQRGGLGADQDLAGLGHVLHRNDAAPRRSGRQQFVMRGAHHEEVEAARVHALRHPQRDLGARHVDPADVAQHAPHQHRGAARPRDVAFVLEPQQQRVAAELEQAGAVVVRDGQDRLEAAADHFGDLLRALPPLAREALGQLGEARHVGEHRGAVGGPPAAVGIVGEVLLQDPRDVEPRPRAVGRRSFGMRDRALGLHGRHGRTPAAIAPPPAPRPGHDVRAPIVRRPPARSWRSATTRPAPWWPRTRCR